MAGPKRSRRSALKQERQPLPKAAFRKWYVYTAATITVFLIVVLFLKQGGEKKETPQSKTTPIAPSVTASVQPSAASIVGAAPEGAMVQSAPMKKNFPPAMELVRLSPKIVFPGTMVKGEAQASDKDGDEVKLTYEWKRNGVIVQGAVSDELDTKAFKKGDMITLYVTPFDEKEKGKTMRSVTIIINNRPPEITSFPPVSTSNGRYVYEVKAVDPDNDKLSYSLVDAPPSMTIDPEKGVIQWDVPPTIGVSYSFMVVVSDGDTKAFQGFTLSPDVEDR